jgi:hypothetical protein
MLNDRGKMKHNPTNPVVKLTVDAKVYSLVFDFEAVAQAEEMLDRALLTGIHKKDIASPPISLVRAMLFACLRVHHPEILFDASHLQHEATEQEVVADVKSLVNRDNIRRIWDSVLEAWTAGLADDEETSPADPQKSQS